MQDIYKVETHPLALSENMITGDKYRITFLTEGLIRLEYDEEGVFEDRPTQMVFFRDFPKADYRVVRTEDGIEVHTKRIHLIYNEKEFTSWGLSIQVKGNYSIWYHYGEEIHDLKGTVRTLDMVDGATELEHGILSRFGYSLVDDSRSQVLLPDGWIEPRRKGIKDLYFFGYGHDYKEALHDFYRLCGKTPMLPRFALGNWWSRYYKYSEESYNELMDKFQEKNIPFTVAVIDMDWHVTDVDPKYGSGWTGYTWNKELFPDPKRFLEGLHKRGMRTTLNVHPADGVQGWEEMYEDMAKAMGVDYENEDPVVCDPASPKFMEAYFKYLHHPREEEGVDFWWIDWQQGSNCKIEGLDPLWIFNHFHFLDSARNGKRPMTFSRYAGPGSHRYPVGFSGDTVVTWESLDFQPYFTATASNVGYTWWSHDIGGHMNGYKDNELALRWYQFGVFSPINRLHSSSNPFCGKEPWNYPEPYCSDMEKILRFRHALIPYMYTLNYRCHCEHIPVIIPMYYYYPFEEKAYSYKNQYFLGGEMLVCPVTTKIDEDSQKSGEECFIPAGIWTDIFTGDVYNGGKNGKSQILCRNLQSIPVLGRAGAIIPLASECGSNDIINPKKVDVVICPGASNTFVMYEDSGDGFDYEKGEYALTEFVLDWNEDKAKISIDVSGDLSVIPRNRKYRFILRGFARGIRFENADNAKYDIKTNTWTVTCNCDGASELEIFADNEENNLVYNGENVNDKIYDFLLQAQMDNNDKRSIYRLFTSGEDKNVIMSNIMSMKLNDKVTAAIMEYLL